MLRCAILILALTVFLSGCLSIAWRSYKKPAATDFETMKCMQIGKQNLNARQLYAIEAAVSDVCTIFNEPEFKQCVTNRCWLASCKKSHGQSDTISGERLYALLSRGIPGFSIHPHKPWMAEGQAENGETELYNRISIDPTEIEGWYSPLDSIRSHLINTLAHESMHILSENFLDYDGAPTCPDSLLVSYGIGDLTETMWLRQHKK